MDKLKTKYAGIILAVISIVLSYVIKIDGLSDAAMHTLGVLLATLFLQIFESFNLCVSCLFSSALLVLTGCVGSVSSAFSGYTNHVLYFTIASFAISAAFQKSLISRKFLSLFMRSDSIGVKKVIFTFMVCAALLSSVMSNVAAVVIFLPYLDKFLEYYKNDEAKAKTSKCINICLVCSAMIGGMITPAGSSMNLIGIDLMEKYAGVRIKFVEWMAFGFPMAVIMIIVAFFIITFIFKPVNPEKSEMTEYIQYLKETEKMQIKDIYIGVLIIVTLFTWILSSWIPAINITVVAIIAMALLFIPGFSVLTWKEFSVVNSWNAFFVAGNHITLASIAISTGLCGFLANSIFGDAAVGSVIPVLIKVAAITFIFMAIIPSAPAVATILIPILITFGNNAGINPVLLFFVSILCVPNIYLFPLDAPLVVAYDRKAFGMFDLPKATVWIQIAMVFLVSFLVYFMYGIIF